MGRKHFRLDPRLPCHLLANSSCLLAVELWRPGNVNAQLSWHFLLQVFHLIGDVIFINYAHVAVFAQWIQCMFHPSQQDFFVIFCLDILQKKKDLPFNWLFSWACFFFPGQIHSTKQYLDNSCTNQHAHPGGHSEVFISQWNDTFAMLTVENLKKYVSIWNTCRILETIPVTRNSMKEETRQSPRTLHHRCLPKWHSVWSKMSPRTSEQVQLIWSHILWQLGVVCQKESSACLQEQNEPSSLLCPVFFYLLLWNFWASKCLRKNDQDNTRFVCLLLEILLSVPDRWVHFNRRLAHQHLRWANVCNRKKNRAFFVAR